MFDEHKEIYLFFADLRPNSITGCKGRLKATEKSEINAGFDEVKEIYLFSELLARALIYDIKGEKSFAPKRYKVSRLFYFIYITYIMYYSLLYVLRTASLMLSTVGIIAFSKFCA